jgi:hypothetical protein
MLKAMDIIKRIDVTGPLHPLRIPAAGVEGALAANEQTN